MPGRDPIAVVNLLEPDSRVGETLLHRGGVRDGGVRGVVQRLNQNAHAAVGDTGGDELLTNADERRSIAAHLEETGLELDVPETVEQLWAWHEALSAERAAAA